MGEMLPQDWEPIATDLAKCTSDAQVSAMMEKILKEHSTAQLRTEADTATGGPVTVVVGSDTRPSAPTLLEAARAGISAMGVTVEDAGKVTTPQLHFAVHARNVRPGHPSPSASIPLYFDTLIGAFESLVEGLPPAPDGGVLHVDCANGIGAAQLLSASSRLRGAGLNLVLHNTGDGRLNHGCGADFVQKERVAPSGFEGVGVGARSVEMLRHRRGVNWYLLTCCYENGVYLQSERFIPQSLIPLQRIYLSFLPPKVLQS